MCVCVCVSVCVNVMRGISILQSSFLCLLLHRSISLYQYKYLGLTCTED